MDKVHKNQMAGMDRRSRRSQEVAEIFDSQYLAYQYCFVEFFIEHLSDVGRAFRGDLQAMLVLALIGQKWLGAVRDAQEEGLDPATLPAARVSTSASRLADVTGIPRQTVRRKLAVMVERGWIEQNEDGTYRMVSTQGKTAARIDLSDVDRRALRRVARLFTDLEMLLCRQQQNVAAHGEERATDDGPDLAAQNERPPPTKT